MQKKFATIDRLFGQRQEVSLKIDDLQRQRRAVENEVLTELMEMGAQECFTINWRAVSRMIRK